MDIEGLFDVIREKTAVSGIENISVSENDAERIFNKIIELSEKENESTRIFEQLRAENEERVNEYISFAPLLMSDEKRKKDKRKLAVFFSLAFPISLLLLSASVGGLASFGVAFTVLFLLAAVSFVLLALSGTLGLAVALINLVYGISELFTNVRAGLAEIFLSVALLGVILLLSVGLYLFSCRSLPFLFRKTVRFFGVTVQKTKEWGLRIREVYRKI